MTVTLRGITWILCLSALAIPLHAHQQKEAITRVLFNERTGNIEVMHRFLLHDAEHAGKQLFGKTTDLLSSEADRSAFERYVYAQFTLMDQNNDPVVLMPVGHEVEGRFLWVYAEAPIPVDLTTLRMSHRALRDLWPDQTNMVNVERGGTVRSAVFRGEQTVVSIDIPGEPLQVETAG